MLHSNSEAEKILCCLPAQIAGRRLTLLFVRLHRPPHRPSLVRLRLLVCLPTQGAWKRLSTTTGRLRHLERSDHHLRLGIEVSSNSSARRRRNGQSNLTTSGRPRVHPAADSNTRREFEISAAQIARDCISGRFGLLVGPLMDHTSSRPSPCTPPQRTHPRGSRPQSALQPRSPGDLSEECRSESNRYLLPGKAQHLRTTTHSDDVYLARSVPMRQKFSGSVTREINT